MWGPASYPSGLPVPTTVFNEAQAKHVHKASMDSHLRSNKAVTGYHIEASDGEIGHVEGFIMDDRAWAISLYGSGHAELVAGQEGIGFSGVDSERQLGALQSPRWPFARGDQDRAEFVESAPITREYEDRLYRHYGQAPYWLHEDESKPSLTMVGV